MKEEAAKALLEKVRDDYDGIADAFSASRVQPWPETERFRTFARPGDRVLDIGCGNGRAYQLFNGLAIDYEGVDVSAKLIRHAKAKTNDMLANFSVGSMTALPYDAGEFDLAMAMAVLHHVPSRALRLQALREAGRVLRPGGWLLMTNWDLWRPARLPLIAVAAFKRLVGLSPYDWNDVFVPWRAEGKDVRRYYHAFTNKELRRLCEDAGFDVVEHRVEGGNFVTVCRKPVPAAPAEKASIEKKN